MAQSVYSSYDFENDAERVARLHEIEHLETDPPMSYEEWQDLRKQGEDTVEEWRLERINDKETTLVLVGSHTAEKPWVRDDIVQSWNDGMAVLGIRIHSLEDAAGDQSEPGRNPFVDLDLMGTAFEEVVPLHSSPYDESQKTFEYIEEKVFAWINEADDIRKNYFGVKF